MTDYPKALAAAREAHTYVKHRGMTRAEAALGDLLAAIDAQVPSGFAYRYRDALAGGTVIRFNSGHEVNGSRPIEAVPYWLGAPPAPVAPAAVVPEGGLRDSVLNSAKFRASCYALVGIVEGIQGLGRCWAANGERLKDTPEWVAFYNCVASMRNGTFNQASAEQAQQPAAAVPEVLCTTCGQPTMHMGSMCYGCTQAAMLAANKVQP